MCGACSSRSNLNTLINHCNHLELVVGERLCFELVLGFESCWSWSAHSVARIPSQIPPLNSSQISFEFPLEFLLVPSKNPLVIIGKSSSFLLGQALLSPYPWPTLPLSFLLTSWPAQPLPPCSGPSRHQVALPRVTPSVLHSTIFC